jgi:alpha-L-fucosidase 2
VLPALPSFWSSGSVQGLKARGDVTVDVSWTDGVPTRIALKAGKSGKLTVSSTMADAVVVDKRTGKRIPVERNGSELTINAAAGHTYVVAAVR